MVVLNKEETLTVAEDAVNLAMKKGANEAEAFVYQGLTRMVSIERAQIVRNSRIIDQGLGIRTIVNKTVGFAYTNVLNNKTAIENTILNSISAAKASRPDPDWHGLPTRKSFRPTKNTYDRKIVRLHSEDLVKLASEMLNAAEETDKRAFPIEGGTGASHLLGAIANSNGIAVSDQGTIIECSLATVAREGNEVTPVCFEFNAERSYRIDPEWIGKEAAQMAVSALKAKKTETKTMDVIFAQLALQEILNYTLINAVKADYVQRNQSAFKGKIGDKVASEIVTIHDDGLLDGGLRTSQSDGEGVPHQETPIIEKGILQNFIYDSYTAKKENRESTGNAARAGYLSTPTVEVTNFHIMPGDESPEELIREVNEGLLVYIVAGAHSSNPASGEFSVVATPAWKIEKGKVAHAVKGAMVAGNIFEVLSNISGLANNERRIGQLVAPWALVENVKVIGK